MLTYKKLKELKEKHSGFHVTVYGEKTVDSDIRCYYGCLNNDIISDNTPLEEYDDLHISEFDLEITDDPISIAYYFQAVFDGCIDIDKLIDLLKDKSDNDTIEIDNYRFIDYDIDLENQLIVLNIDGELHNDAPIEYDGEDMEDDDE